MTKMAEIRICKNCGAELHENDKFCKNCGSPVNNVDDSDNEVKMEEQNSGDSIEFNGGKGDSTYGTEGTTQSAEDTTKNSEETLENEGHTTRQMSNTEEDTERPQSHVLRNVLIAVVAVVCVGAAFGVGVFFGNNNTSDVVVKSEEDQGNPEEEEDTSEEDMTMDEMFSDPEQVNPREFAAYVNGQVVSGKLSGEEYWDKYVSEESSSYVIKSEYVNCFDNAQKYNKTIGYLSISYQEWNEDDNKDEDGDEGESKEEYRVLGTVQTLSKSDELTTTQTYDYVVVEDGKYKFDVTNHLGSIFNFLDF